MKRKQIFSLLMAVVICTSVFPFRVAAYSTGDDYPDEYKNAAFQANIADRWNFYVRNCTSFVAWCLNSRNGVSFHNYYRDVHWGNANNWDNAAISLGITVNDTPAVGAVAQTDSGSNGHVAWVSAVSNDKVTIDEYNYGVKGGYGTRTVSSSNFRYIHIADISGGQSTQSSAGKQLDFNVSNNPVTANMDAEALPAGLDQVDVGKSYYFNLHTNTNLRLTDAELYIKPANSSSYLLEYVYRVNSYFRWTNYKYTFNVAGEFSYYWKLTDTNGDTRTFTTGKTIHVQDQNTSPTSAKQLDFNVSNNHVTGNMDDASLPAGLGQVEEGKTYYFNLQTNTNLRLTDAELYIKPADSSDYRLEFVKSVNSYFRWTYFSYTFNVAGSFAYYWKLTDTDGVTRTFSNGTINVLGNNHYLDVNGYLDGTNNGKLLDYGKVDVYINGSLVASQQNDYYASHPTGTQFSIENIRPATGYLYHGVREHEGSLSGTIGDSDYNVRLQFRKSVNVGTGFYAFIGCKSLGLYLTNDGTSNVIANKRSNSKDQIWYFERQNDNAYVITSAKDGKVLDIEKGSSSRGANVLAYERQNSINQMWYIHEQDGLYLLGSKITECVLDVYGGKSEEGSNIDMWTDHGGGSELFSIERIEDTPVQNVITVTLNPNGGTVNPSQIAVAYGNTYNTLPTPSRTGYSFVGWFTSASGGNEISNGTSVTNNKAHTLFAHWRANQYSVTLDANGGRVSLSSLTVTFDAAYGNLPTPTLSGRTFLGWFTEKSGGIRITNSSKVTQSTSHTLYAHWDMFWRFGRDNFNFLNAYSVFGKKGSPIYISNSDLFDFTNRLSNNEFLLLALKYGQGIGEQERIANFGRNKLRNWGGSCYGMSLLAALMRAGIDNPTRFGGSTTYSIPAFNSSTNTYLESQINIAHISQFTKNALYYKLAEVNSSQFPGIAREMYNKALEIGVNSSALPYIVRLCTETGGHAVVCFGAEEGTWFFNGKMWTKRLLIADPNETQDQYIYMTNSFSDALYSGDFSYNEFGYRTSSLYSLNPFSAYHDTSADSSYIYLQDAEFDDIFLFNTNNDEEINIRTSDGTVTIKNNTIVRTAGNVDAEILYSDDKAIDGTTESDDGILILHTSDDTVSVYPSTQNGLLDVTVFMNDYATTINGNTNEAMVSRDGDITLNETSEELQLLLAANDSPFDFVSISGYTNGDVAVSLAKNNSELYVLGGMSNYSVENMDREGNIQGFDVIGDGDMLLTAESVSTGHDGTTGLAKATLSARQDKNGDGNFDEELHLRNANYDTISPDAISLEIENSIMVIGETATIDYTVTPAEASNKAVTWSSSNPLVISVDENGKVIALSHGTAEVTASTVDGNQSDTVQFRVYKSGDVNGDDKVDMRDMILLGNYLARKKGVNLSSIVSETSDVDSRKGIAMTDLITLGNHLAHRRGYETLPHR